MLTCIWGSYVPIVILSDSRVYYLQLYTSCGRYLFRIQKMLTYILLRIIIDLLAC
ncbi:hypothetical protein MtrunA17_Chr1g0156091 [Medicago truncatula]|uniref:Uncharacterized protein n=1 Tax=Medicago truncatula TaxID=3880 RepID=A0A396JMM1_MEDTR|nr:hypothetical protein MtrunA17_Chr1g0156091 [Medicago truncatula]